jgi:acyl-CoA synthetase (NDP forming)
VSALARLLRPRSIAIIGASADSAKTTGRPVGDLQRHGFDGAIWPVDPSAAEIGGLRLLGPNTIGLVDLGDRIVLSASAWQRPMSRR